MAKPNETQVASKEEILNAVDKDGAKIEPGTVHIRLLQPHTHAGRDFPAGTKLTLHVPSADWLISIGVAELA